MKIINRYIFKELLGPFSLSIAFFTFVFLMTKILEITNLIVNFRIGIGVVGRMIFFAMPYFMVFTIPMSVMLAVLLTFLRMANDNEINALKAGGVSLRQLLPPVLFFCGLGAAITAWMITVGMPWGAFATKKTVFEIAHANLNVGLKERTFIDQFDDIMLYITRLDVKQNMLHDIYIEDRRNKEIVSTIVAPKGVLMGTSDEERGVLRLFDGSVNRTRLSDRSINSIRFDTYDISLDFDNMDREEYLAAKEEIEMTFGELVDNIQHAEDKSRTSNYYNELRMELQRKLAVPVSCLVLGLLGIPLGVRAKTGKRSVGIVLGLGFFLLFYLMQSIGDVYGDKGTLSPFAAIWYPNFVMTAIMLFLFKTTR
ncbi:LPS export ABC transporter permease LptF [Desulfobacterales bacterium HSG17]|nr:LPS export ABC transporter permease LptF [Desulfobacterales bacterium HSG17]